MSANISLYSEIQKPLSSPNKLISSHQSAVRGRSTASNETMVSPEEKAEPPLDVKDLGETVIIDAPVVELKLLISR